MRPVLKGDQLKYHATETKMRRLRILDETAAERSARFTEELDAVDRMTEAELRREVARLADRADFLGVIARTVKTKHSCRCSKCPYPAGCIMCDLP